MPSTTMADKGDQIALGTVSSDASEKVPPDEEEEERFVQSYRLGEPEFREPEGFFTPRTYLPVDFLTGNCRAYGRWITPPDCNCCYDFPTWCLGCCCPMITHGWMMEAEGLGPCWLHCFMATFLCYLGFPWLAFLPRRRHIRETRGLPEYPFPHCDFCVSCFCQSCATVQEYTQVTKQALRQSIWVMVQADTSDEIIEEALREPKMTQVLVRKDGRVDVVYQGRVDRLSHAAVEGLVPILADARNVQMVSNPTFQPQMRLPTEKLPLAPKGITDPPPPHPGHQKQSRGD
ncbi:hypothetical protein DFJ74DRAFT_750226 [Hyaloraphidium curvatum]|nr:hypothetical protein DFJ74DRAFT_750226 [Hyaloraphidium curvatum]